MMHECYSEVCKGCQQLPSVSRGNGTGGSLNWLSSVALPVVLAGCHSPLILVCFPSLPGDSTQYSPSNFSSHLNQPGLIGRLLISGSYESLQGEVDHVNFPNSAGDSLGLGFIGMSNAAVGPTNTKVKKKS